MTHYAVYIVASGRNGTLYIGMTNSRARRIWEHKNKVVPGFTAKYGCDHLVYFELFEDIQEAMLREKRLKDWKRAWKITLIEEANPLWNDLYDGLEPA